MATKPISLEVWNPSGKYRVVSTKSMPGTRWIRLLTDNDCRLEVHSFHSPLLSSALLCCCLVVVLAVCLCLSVKTSSSALLCSCCCAHCLSPCLSVKTSHN
jgi:hypothetical protein